MSLTRRVLGLSSVVMIFSQLTAHGAVNMADSVSIDSLSTITVYQPYELEQRLLNAPSSDVVGDVRDAEVDSNSGAATRIGGYRVQVFSDNNQRTAKSEARSKERLIREEFPDYETYVVYNSPFWRLKIGDFRTQHEAEAVADEIKSRFPSFSREVRVVRDRINNTHR